MRRANIGVHMKKILVILGVLLSTSVFAGNVKLCAQQAKVACRDYAGEEQIACMKTEMSFCMADYSKSNPQCFEYCSMIEDEAHRELCYESCSERRF